jgi:peptidylamidoglycolate lyase
MLKRLAVISLIAVAFVAGYLIIDRNLTVEGQGQAQGVGRGFSAVPGAVGAMDITGPYDVVRDWPKDVSTLAGNEGKWTWGAGQGVFAESPNRVYIVQRGLLPVMPAGGGRGQPGPFTPVNEQLGRIFPGAAYPVAGLARNATGASPPGMLDTNAPCGGANQPKCIAGNYDNDGSGKNGVDFLWQDCIIVSDANGNIESWRQWDAMLRRPHSVYISPFDATKAVYVVDDYRHAIFKFSNDGKQLLQTIGTPNEHASDPTHFHRPTFMAFQMDGSFYVADGYNNTRVVKFDKDGKYLLAWGERGQANETRPNYMNNVHGVTVDPQTREVYVNDRNNDRIQVFDENGKFIRMWKFGPDNPNMHFVHMDADRRVWVFDNAFQRLLQYDREGRLVYGWGSLGNFPGALWGVHGISVDQEQNLYLAAVSRGGVQKFRPKQGADPRLLVGKHVYSAWR